MLTEGFFILNLLRPRLFRQHWENTCDLLTLINHLQVIYSLACGLGRRWLNLCWFPIEPPPFKLALARTGVPISTTYHHPAISKRKVVSLGNIPHLLISNGDILSGMLPSPKRITPIGRCTWIFPAATSTDGSTLGSVRLNWQRVGPLPGCDEVQSSSKLTLPEKHST